MTKKSYSDKLRDPRWQKMRLEVLSRDSFTCQLCNDTGTELQVHHKYYLPNAEPWEYELDALQTLCRHCHFATEELIKDNHTVLIASKASARSDASVVVHTIISRQGDHLILHMWRIWPDGKHKYDISISESTAKDMILLFKSAAKLESIPA